MHADAIARLVFRRGAKGKKASGKKASQGLRRRYRQLRSKLNERNGHLADRMLSMRRAGELECTAITAGFLAKSRRYKRFRLEAMPPTRFLNKASMMKHWSSMPSDACTSKRRRKK